MLVIVPQLEQFIDVDVDVDVDVDADADADADADIRGIVDIYMI
jgi:hypothetical protein